MIDVVARAMAQNTCVDKIVSTNRPCDGQVLSFNASSNKFTWVDSVNYNYTYLYNNSTGNNSISKDITNPSSTWILKHILLHLNDIGLSDNLVITIKNGEGEDYNVQIENQNMTDICDYFNIFDDDIILKPTDILNISWLNSNGLTYGLEVAYISL